VTLYVATRARATAASSGNVTDAWLET
jgi:hypothetical protein